MVDVAPFRGVRYDPAVAGDPRDTSAPAYDELEPFVYARHRTASPYTILELLAPRDPDGYAAAGAALDRWWRTGVLIRDERPAFYRYEEHELRGGVPAVQRGVLVALALEPLDGTGSVLAHEAVDPTRVGDRLERLDAVPLDVSPVFALYRDAPPALTRLLDARPTRPPVVRATDEQGADHRVWALDSPEEIDTIRQALADVTVVIADGHHRYATALANAHRARFSTGEPALERAPRVLAYLVDARAHGPRVLPVHRLVSPFPAEALDILERDFALEPATADPRGLGLRLQAAAGSRRRERRRCADGSTGEARSADHQMRRRRERKRCADGSTGGAPAPSPDRVLGLRLPGPRGLLLRSRDEAALAARLPSGRSSLWRSLDTAILEHAVLPGLGLRGANVVARSDAVAAAAAVDAGQAGALFMVRPVANTTVLALAAAGEPMPPKSTSFQPKPRTGLIMRALDD